MWNEMSHRWATLMAFFGTPFSWAAVNIYLRGRRRVIIRFVKVTKTNWDWFV